MHDEALAPAPAAPTWWQALNPPIYLISVLPGLGILLAAGFSYEVLAPLLPATLAVILLQHGINLLNDASDWRLGADIEKSESWVRYQQGDLRKVEVHGLLSLAAGALLGLAVLVLTDRLWILAVATPMVVLGYLYNAGKKPLSYTRLGEWVTGLCYGPGVYGCLWLLIGGPSDAGASASSIAGAVAGSLAFAALAVALLLSHQPPQIDTDRAAGKNSFAVRYGADITRRSSVALYLLFVVSFVLALWLHHASPVVVLTFAGLGLAGTTGLRPPAPPLILKSASAALVAPLIIALLLPAL